MSTADDTALHAARTQSLFRRVNERIATLNGAFAQVVPMADWICECADATCFTMLALTMDEYDAIRAHPARFPVLHGHEVLEVEAVVETTERYIVVEKFGVAGELAVANDPRAG